MFVRLNIAPIWTRQPIQCNSVQLNRVGEMEGRYRRALSCKRSFVCRMREKYLGKSISVEREERRDETLLQSELKHIVKRHSC
jgi:hypothetical protein